MNELITSVCNRWTVVKLQVRGSGDRGWRTQEFMKTRHWLFPLGWNHGDEEAGHLGLKTTVLFSIERGSRGRCRARLTRGSSLPSGGAGALRSRKGFHETREVEEHCVYFPFIKKLKSGRFTESCHFLSSSSF